MMGVAHESRMQRSSTPDHSDFVILSSFDIRASSFIEETSRSTSMSMSRRALARDEWAEGVPGFAPFAFTLPKARFEVSKVTGVTLYVVQRL